MNDGITTSSNGDIVKYCICPIDIDSINPDCPIHGTEAELEKIQKLIDECSERFRAVMRGESYDD